MTGTSEYRDGTLPTKIAGFLAMRLELYCMNMIHNHFFSFRFCCVSQNFIFDLFLVI